MSTNTAYDTHYQKGWWGHHMYTVWPTKAGLWAIERWPVLQRAQIRAINGCKPNRLMEAVLFLGLYRQGICPWLNLVLNQSRPSPKSYSIWSSVCITGYASCVFTERKSTQNRPDPSCLVISNVPSSSEYMWPVYNHVVVFSKARVTKHGINYIIATGTVSFHFDGWLTW